MTLRAARSAKLTEPSVSQGVRPRLRALTRSPIIAALVVTETVSHLPALVRWPARKNGLFMAVRLWMLPGPHGRPCAGSPCFGGHTFQAGTGQSEDPPVLQHPGTQFAVKADRGLVPVENRPFQTSTAPLQGEACQMSQELAANSLAPG